MLEVCPVHFVETAGQPGADAGNLTQDWELWVQIDDGHGKIHVELIQI